jgi:flagellar protein FlgJ
MLSDLTQNTLELTTSQLDRNRFEAPGSDSELREAAEQFEAIFLNEWIKQARKTKLADDILGSSSMDKYQEMLDREYASSLASGVNLGIAEALIRQFEGQGK